MSHTRVQKFDSPPYPKIRALFLHKIMCFLKFYFQPLPPTSVTNTVGCREEKTVRWKRSLDMDEPWPQKSVEIAGKVLRSLEVRVTSDVRTFFCSLRAGEWGSVFGIGFTPKVRRQTCLRVSSFLGLSLNKLNWSRFRCARNEISVPNFKKKTLRNEKFIDLDSFENLFMFHSFPVSQLFRKA